MVSFLGPLAQMVDRDAACAKAVMALCAEITVEVASSSEGATAGGSAGAKHKKVGRSLVWLGGANQSWPRALTWPEKKNYVRIK